MVAVVAVSALPVVFWLPVAFTPGKLMFAEPSNDTPPMFLAVARAVAVAALPVNAAVIVPALKLPEPSLATIALDVLAFVAVVALLETFPLVVMVFNFVSAIAASDFIPSFTITPDSIDAVPSDAIEMSLDILLKT